jgi:hypothetical protein
LRAEQREGPEEAEREGDRRKLVDEKKNVVSKLVGQQGGIRGPEILR